MREQDGRHACDFITMGLNLLWGFWPIDSPLKNSHASGAPLNFAKKLLIFQYPAKHFNISPSDFFTQNLIDRLRELPESFVLNQFGKWHLEKIKSPNV